MNRLESSDTPADDRRFAALVGLGVTLGVARVLLLDAMRGFQPLAWAQFPLFFRHDALVVFVLAWLTCWPPASRGRLGRLSSAILWSVGSLLLIATSVNLLL